MHLRFYAIRKTDIDDILEVCGEPKDQLLDRSYSPGGSTVLGGGLRSVIASRWFCWSVGDLYVHADLHGASSIVVKNPSSTFVYLCTLLFIFAYFLFLNISVLCVRFHYK